LGACKACKSRKLLDLQSLQSLQERQAPSLADTQQARLQQQPHGTVLVPEGSASVMGSKSESARRQSRGAAVRGRATSAQPAGAALAVLPTDCILLSCGA